MKLAWKTTAVATALLVAVLGKQAGRWIADWGESQLFPRQETEESLEKLVQEEPLEKLLPRMAQDVSQRAVDMPLLANGHVKLRSVTSGPGHRLEYHFTVYEMDPFSDESR